MTIESWKTQMRKGAAELAVLALLSDEARSRVALLQAFNSHPEIGLSGGSIYPLLNRLEREGKIAGTWVTEATERPMKAYGLTKTGKGRLAEMLIARRTFEHDLQSLLREATGETD